MGRRHDAGTNDARLEVRLLKLLKDALDATAAGLGLSLGDLTRRYIEKGLRDDNT